MPTRQNNFLNCAYEIRVPSNDRRSALQTRLLAFGRLVEGERASELEMARQELLVLRLFTGLDAMKERPILFSGPMVRAILDGRKTQTRRVVKPQPFHAIVRSCSTGAKLDDEGKLFHCPYGCLRDTLWVRETFLLANGGTACYCRADMSSFDAVGFGAMYGGWKPSIFMPHQWSRITLEITDVRVERVQDISTNDALSEGVSDYSGDTKGEMPWPKQAYQILWDSINGKNHPWSSNPWVWAITFKQV